MGLGPHVISMGGEFGGGSLTEGYGDGRPNRAAALGLRRAAASGNRRSPVRAPGHRFQIRAYRCDEESEANPSRGFFMWAKLWERPATGAIGGGSGAPWQALFRRWEGKLGLGGGGGGGRRGDVVR